MEHIYLSGSEDVSHAGHNMISAAESMNRAAASITYSMEQLERTLQNFLVDLQEILEKNKK